MPTESKFTEPNEFSVNSYEIKTWQCPRCSYRKELEFNHRLESGNELAFEEAKLHIEEHSLDE